MRYVITIGSLLIILVIVVSIIVSLILYFADI